MFKSTFLNTNFRHRFMTSILIFPLTIFMIWYGGVLFSLFFLIISFIACAELFFMMRRKPYILIWHKVTVFSYLCIGLLCLFHIRQNFGLNYALFLITCVVATDIGAYIIGRLWGKTPLCPRISPKKTCEGGVGGLLFAAVAALFFKLSWIVLLLALLLSAISQIGDLLESAFKRFCGVKDSGTWLVGHGGILDRLDSFLLAGIALQGILMVKKVFFL